MGHTPLLHHCNHTTSHGAHTIITSLYAPHHMGHTPLLHHCTHHITWGTHHYYIIVRTRSHGAHTIITSLYASHHMGHTPLLHHCTHQITWGTHHYYIIVRITSHGAHTIIKSLYAPDHMGHTPLLHHCTQWLFSPSTDNPSLCSPTYISELIILLYYIFKTFLRWRPLKDEISNAAWNSPTETRWMLQPNCTLDLIRDLQPMKKYWY